MKTKILVGLLAVAGISAVAPSASSDPTKKDDSYGYIFEDDALKALFDRFLLRVRSDNVAPEQLLAVLDAGWKLQRTEPLPAAALHFEEIECLQRLLPLRSQLPLPGQRRLVGGGLLSLLPQRSFQLCLAGGGVLLLLFPGLQQLLLQRCGLLLLKPQRIP